MGGGVFPRVYKEGLEERQIYQVGNGAVPQILEGYTGLRTLLAPKCDKKKQGCVLSEGSLWQATEATEYSLTDDFYL